MSIGNGYIVREEPAWVLKGVDTKGGALLVLCFDSARLGIDLTELDLKDIQQQYPQRPEQNKMD